MLADHEKKQLPIRKKNEIESQQEQRKKYETARIVIGMSIWEVEDLCGQANDTSTLESARGTIMTLKYEFSEKRKANDCFGTLTFIDYELDSIYRD